MASLDRKLSGALLAFTLAALVGVSGCSSSESEIVQGGGGATGLGGSAGGTVAGQGGGEAVAKLLFGDAAPRGKLPWHLPRSMDQVGDESKNQAERWDLPFDLGATDAQRTEIRALIDQGKPVPPTYGDPLYRFGDGLQAW
jgi:hypothetical protein